MRFEQVFDTYSNLERQMEESFQNPNKRWREGSAKTAFTYLLLDSSVTLNLPLRAANMSLPELVRALLLRSVSRVPEFEEFTPMESFSFS